MFRGSILSIPTIDEIRCKANCAAGLLLVTIGFSASFSAFGADKADKFVPQETIVGVPSDKVMMANGATIGKITFHVGDVFDLSNPKENKGLFRLANSIHVNTRDHVIADQLLFKRGDLYSPDVLSESERILRSNVYLYDAVIRPIRYDNNQVDIEVKTRDVWTLTGGINYSRKGQEDSYGFEIEEKNFIGLGKTVKVRRNADEFRTENEFEYHDPFMGHNRFQMTIGYSDNSDGRVKAFELKRPFYSLDTRWAMDLGAKTYTRREVIYENGEIAERFVQEDKRYNISAGYSRGSKKHYAARWRIGYTMEENRFSAYDATEDTQQIPLDRNLSYPWIKYDGIFSDYIKTERVNQINRTEDINLGDVYSIKLGWSDESFGADRNALIFSVDYHSANRTFSKQMLLTEVKTSGRLGKNFSENMLIKSQARYFYPVFENQVFYTELNIDAGHNLDRDNQLLLGGESGLRGYPARIQNGNRRLLFKMEHRFYTDLHVLQLFYVAGAAFFDIGRAWTPGVDPEQHSGYLKDVGIGLRFASSRSGRGAILHMDYAFALDADENIKQQQFLVSTESRF